MLSNRINRIKILILGGFFFLCSLSSKVYSQYTFFTKTSEYQVIDLSTNTVYRSYPYAVQHSHRPVITDQNGQCFIGAYENVDDIYTYEENQDAVHRKYCCYDINGKMLLSNIDAIDAVVSDDKQNKIIAYLQGTEVDDPGHTVITGIGVYNYETKIESKYKFDPPLFHSRHYNLEHLLNINLLDGNIYLYARGEVLRFESNKLEDGYKIVAGGLIYTDDNIYSTTPNSGKIYKNGVLYDEVNEIKTNEEYYTSFWIKGTNILYSPPYVYNADSKDVIIPDYQFYGTVFYYDRSNDAIYSNCRVVVDVKDLIPGL